MSGYVYSQMREIQRYAESGKIRETTQKLLNHLESAGITQELILSQETVRWTVTTPLYNIGGQS